MPFDPEFSIDGLRGADYNPRKITPDALDSLKGSIQELGFCKPIIVTPDGLIVAGHQRTKAARALGITHVPAWVLGDIKVADEMRFNQLHNGTDLDDVDGAVRVPPSTSLGFEEVPGSDVEGDLRGKGAVVRSEICKLVLSHGPWGGIVATQSGEVVSSPQYALACRMLSIPCRTYRVRDEQGALALGWFGKVYGEFSYDALPRNPWKQTFAQPMRLRGSSQHTSRLYERFVIPQLTDGERALDFGCGQGDYVKKLRTEGRRIWGVEFFVRDGSNIATGRARAMIDVALQSVREEGLFDVVVCDSVVNSVDRPEAVRDVMTCLNAFCRPGGRIYFSGRRKGLVEEALRRTRVTGHTRRDLEFLDPDGFSAIHRKGGWFFQRFHTRDEALALGREFVGDNLEYAEGEGWMAYGKKERSIAWADLEPSVRREFELPWPGGRSVGRGNRAIEALAPCYADG
jgi:ParB family transcriptional regulator, chromosome partitioning protein